jgi:hypothetical protein
MLTRRADLTVKSRMQSGQAEGRKYKSSFDGIQSIIRDEGARTVSSIARD